MLSISGLKLERMLTMIYKKKRNFKVESINNVINKILGIQLGETSKIYWFKCFYKLGCLHWTFK